MVFIGLGIPMDGMVSYAAAGFLESQKMNG